MAKRDFETELPVMLFDQGETLKLPDPGMVDHYMLRKERKVFFDFAVDETTLDVERRILLWNMEDREVPADYRTPIWLYIFNYGGDVNLEQSMIDLIDASVTPIYTVNLGVCASAAAEIFTAGKKRFMMRNARIMYHQGSGALQGDAQKMADQMADYNRQLEKAKTFLLSRTKITADEYELHKYNDWWLDAEECLRLGVCDQIVQSLDEVL